MIKSILKFNNKYFEINDIVTIKKKDSIILTGKILEFTSSPLLEQKICLDISTQYQTKITLIYVRDIETIITANNYDLFMYQANNDKKFQKLI